MDDHSNVWKCTCPEGRTGDRCEQSTRCEGGCSGGQCVLSTKGAAECRCPPGIGMVVDEHGNQSCARYTATSCKELECAHGHCYGSIKSEDHLRVRVFQRLRGIALRPAGLLALLRGRQRSAAWPTDFRIACAGRDSTGRGVINGWTGQQRRDLGLFLPVVSCSSGSRLLSPFSSSSSSRILRAVKRQRHAEGHKQFQHERMLEEEPPNDEVGEFQCHNPAFLADDEEPDGREAEKDDPTRVYNETVLSNNPDGSPSASSSSFAGLPERFNLLRSTIEFR
ncbi:hypothetical protein M3Y99_01963000 [Aphelenchoides fujianensis]|nr:hypothetical protein M3Y99_01963000 [Aphelenchoides fujianensis]